MRQRGSGSWELRVYAGTLQRLGGFERKCPSFLPTRVCGFNRRGSIRTALKGRWFRLFAGVWATDVLVDCDCGTYARLGRRAVPGDCQRARWRGPKGSSFDPTSPRSAGRLGHGIARVVNSQYCVSSVTSLSSSSPGANRSGWSAEPDGCRQFNGRCPRAQPLRGPRDRASTGERSFLDAAVACRCVRAFGQRLSRI